MALVILASGFGFGGNQLLLMASLPSLGFAAAAVSRTRGETPRRARWLPIAVLVGLATAAVLVLFDSEELTILLDEGNGDIPTWAAAATAASAVLGWVAGLISVLVTRASGAAASRRLSVIALGSWAVLLMIYFGYGQPGLHGDALFVVLRDQADVSAASALGGRTERTSYVYSTLTSHATASQAGLRPIWIASASATDPTTW